MNDLVTKEDLKNAVAVISERQADFRSEVRIAFSDVKERQDRTNGRIDRCEAMQLEQARSLSDHGQTMAGVVATMKVLDSGHRDMAAAAPKLTLSDDQKPGITQRDIKVAVFMFAIGGALIEYGPKVLKALSAIGAQP